MTDKACAICVKRHVVALVVGGQLECRAAPPVQDVALHARFPLVKPDDYCHSGFELDAAAAKARAASAALLADLDQRVADTQAHEAARMEAGDADASDDPSASAPKRARRARASADQGGLL